MSFEDSEVAYILTRALYASIILYIYIYGVTSPKNNKKNQYENKKKL
jgi:predicted butyrate kinase (DUF1464 family)